MIRRIAKFYESYAKHRRGGKERAAAAGDNGETISLVPGAGLEPAQTFRSEGF